jgi:hypothetical protein
VLSHTEVTGIPTPGDVGLLGMLIRAEKGRIAIDRAQEQLAADGDYSSPFISMPF